MKTAMLKIATLGFIFVTGDLFAQLEPPGGGGSGGGGTNSGNSTSYTPPNTNFLIAVQNTNVVLNWRTSTNKIFLLEQRNTLTGATAWGELTNYYLSAANTNWTKFVHTNIVKTQPTSFYRLFDVTPVAKPDFFAVDQDSSANQLDIFQNDTVPNDDLIIITNLISAQHGSISYTPNATTFEYTPDSGFYGVDTFAYSITSKHGEISSNATVRVFVNQTGNNPPSVPDIFITLQTNVHTATFNALTNATDPDGDTNILFAVNPPNLGSVSNSISGNITYTRNPSQFGSDAFTYIVTDGHGGYGVGNVKIVPVDSDGDGMPDEWEMANGLDPFSDDSANDPDGDGLPNLAEFQLGVNPHAADNPLNSLNVTNGLQISGFAQLPILGFNSMIQPPLINFFVNSNFAQHSFIAQAADGQWRVNWDTTFLTNGNYQVQLACQVAPLGSPDSIINIFGATKTVQVSNPIVFDSLTSQFTDAMFIYGLLAVTNSTYDVNLFDEDGSPLVHATGLSAQNGQIALYWDLTDGNGNQISFGNIQAVFTIHPPANPLGIQPRTPQSPTQTSRWFLKDAANTGGAFTVAWGWDSYSTSFNNKREGLMADGVINVLGNPADPNSYNLLPVANIPYGGSSFRYDSASDKTILMHALTASGNFFWMGHGNDRVIMGNEKISGLGFADIVALLGNTAFMSSPKKPRTNKHPYHLVILNACETYSDLWANAFGIDFSASGSHDTAADYDLVHRPKRAFVGWTKSVFLPNSFDTSGLKHAQYASALETLFGYWMAGYPLEYCMQYYTISATSNGFTGADSWKISGCVGVQRN